MSPDADFLIRLVGLPAVLDQHATLEEGLKELAALTATHPSLPGLLDHVARAGR